MLLSQLLNNITCEEIIGDCNIQVSGLCVDSKKIVEGNVFICYVGGKHDSHNYINQAIEGGAAAIICQKKVECKLPTVIVKDGRVAATQLARAFYGFADKKLNLIGVTGTNGKTTITYMLKSIFDNNSQKTAVIGTLGIVYCGKFISPELTTPDPIFLHSIFADMVECGVQYVFMEVSAHALYYDKIMGLHFKVGIFTNCTQDHLDFFDNMGEYAHTKSLMFKQGRCDYSVINCDDDLGIKLLNSVENSYSYGLNNPADTFAIDIDQKISGTHFVINAFDALYEVDLRIPALHNVYNALAAATCAMLLGVKIDKIAEGLCNLKRVDGRLELVATHNGGSIFVDFAHTPDGLEKCLSSLKKLCSGKLYCIFGCGGNRDVTKRPIMGEVAAKYADFIILTSDNPRYEDAYDIISQIEVGLKDSDKPFVEITDRRCAIEYGINILGKNDILLVAGKGGENYQEIMGIKHNFNDCAVIKNAIKKF